MNTTHTPELEEKTRLRQHLQLQQYSSEPSPSRSPASGSNTVPIQEELDSPLASSHTQLPPAPLTAARTPSSPSEANPPPYSGPSVPTPEPAPSPDAQAPNKPSPRYPGLPALDYRLYKPALFELSSDRTTIRTSVPYLSISAEALISLIRQQATVPPKPQIHIVGRRGGRTDFSIKLNLMPLLVPDNDQRLDYLRCVGPDEVAFRGGMKPATEPELPVDGWLEAWVERFIADKASVKSFTLERVVINMDMLWIEGQIRALVAGMKYPGSVAVSFPVTHSRVVVNSPDRVNKFFTSVTGFFAGRHRYEVVKAIWPFATKQGSGEAGRKCAVQSEEVWWKEWREPIRYAIATKRHGWVTNEDKLEAIMEGVPSTVPAVPDWGPEYVM